MRRTRTHTIGFCCSDQQSEREAFLDVARRAETAFSDKRLIARTPPPERDVLLQLRIFKDPVEILGLSLDRFFGVALEPSLIVKDGAAQIGTLETFDGILLRLSKQNIHLKYYGIKFSIFAPLPEAACLELYGFFDKWTTRLSSEVGISVSFDLATDYTQFEHILENEHRRMVHGDIKAQFAALTL